MGETKGAVAAAVLMFVLELGLLGAAGFWAMTVFGTVWAGVIAVVAVAAAWGLLLSPKAVLRPAWPWHAVAGHLAFLLGGIVLVVGGQSVLGWVYLGLVALSAVLNVLHRDGLARQSAADRETRTTPAQQRPRPTGRRAAR